MAETIWTAIAAEAPYMLRLVVAGVCGFIIGLERSMRQKEAGIRTHIVVIIGAALAMVISKYAFFDVVIYDGIQADASRIASQIVTGVGFLGAGVIFVRGATIRGLTTAAGIWTTAAIGMAIGAGMYPIGIAATLLVVALQMFLHRYVHIEKNLTTDLEITLANEPEAPQRLRRQLEEKNIDIVSFEIRKTEQNELHCLLTVMTKQELSFKKLETLMAENDTIRAFSL